MKKGDLIAKVDDAPVYATLDGVLRGILRDGLPVPKHFKIADIDPRLSERENCFTISDKASAIAGGVLRAICIYENGLRSGEGKIIMKCIPVQEAVGSILCHDITADSAWRI